jgi:hypothetical protein
MIELVDVGTIELTDLPLDDPSVIVFRQFFVDLFPTCIVLRQRKWAKPCFLTAADRLHS